MPPKSARSKGGQTILNFFHRSAPLVSSSTGTQSVANGSRSAPLLVDGAADDQVEDHVAAELSPVRPLKRLRASPEGTSLDTKKRSPSNRAQQWKFVSEQDGAQITNHIVPSSQRSVEEDRRHKDFKDKLLGPSDPIRQRDEAVREEQEDREEARAQEEEEVMSKVPPGQGSDDEEDADEDTGSLLARSNLSSGVSRKGRIGSDKPASGSCKNSSTVVKYTPLELQVVEIKAKHSDVLLLFEVGYKYIAYGDDAVVASKELNIACFPKNNLRQASIPTHRLHIHARRLVNAGYKVGVVRQTETAALKAVSTNASKPFTRELTELYTASTWVEDLETDTSRGDAPPAQNSLLALTERLEGGNYGGDERVSIGLIAVQAATGAIVFDQFTDSSMRSELETRLAHLQPAELLLPPEGKLSKPTEKLLRHFVGTTSTSRSAGLTATKVRVERTENLMSYNEAFSLISDFYEHVASSAVAGEDCMSLDADQLQTEVNESGMHMAVRASNPKDDSKVGQALAFIMKMPHLSIIALATSLQHLESFGLTSMFKAASSFVSFQAKSEMLLSTGTLYNLELFLTTEGAHRGSLLWLLDTCKTAFGQRQLRKWISRPLTDLARLKERTDAVTALLEGKSAILSKISGLLIQQPDLEKGLARILYGRATPSELATVLLALNRISKEFTSTETVQMGTGSSLLDESIAALPRIADTITHALSAINLVAARKGEKENMFVEDKYPQLRDEKDRIAVVDSELREHLMELRRVLKRPTLEYATVSAIECLVEVKVADAWRVPLDWLRMSATKSMIRFHTPTIMQLLKVRNRHKERLAISAAQCYQAFLEELCDTSVDLRNCIAALGTLDALKSLAGVAAQPGYVKPTYVEGEGFLEICGLKHPMSAQVRDDYVPNDVRLGSSKGVILTGANMGGKSSTVRAVALCVILGQIGSYVPAESAMMTIHDAVLTRMGASDELAKGRSTFMVEAEEAAEIMRASTSRSLVILDELGRGTSTFDGQAIASSILTHLMTREERRRPTVLFITHYTSLCQLADRLPGVCNMHMQFLEIGGGDGKQKDVVFLYKLKEGPAASSFGIHCASLADLPRGLLEVATQRAKDLEVHTEVRLRKKRLIAARRVLMGAFGPSATQEDVERTRAAALKLGIDLADD